MKKVFIIIISIALTGCAINTDNKTEPTKPQIQTQRHIPFINVKKQPEPNNIIINNPMLSDVEWTYEWYDLISAHESYLRNYIKTLVSSMNMEPKTHCDVSAIIKGLKEPVLPTVKGVSDPEEVNLILAKALRSMYDNYNSLLDTLKTCK